MQEDQMKLFHARIQTLKNDLYNLNQTIITSLKNISKAFAEQRSVMAQTELKVLTVMDVMQEKLGIPHADIQAAYDKRVKQVRDVQFLNNAADNAKRIVFPGDPREN